MSDLETIAQYLQATGVDITAQDLEELRLYHWEQSQKRDLGLARAGDPGYEDPFDPEADIGKTLGFVFGAVLGAFFLPGLGIAAGWLGGAVIGGAIGQRLVGIFDGSNGGQSAPVKSVTDPIYNFSGTGSLVELGALVPKIYGNRTINPDGGVYLRDPACIYSRVINKQGSRYLRQLFILAYGPLGQVNQAGLLIDDKPRTDWEANDITTAVSPGTLTQSALGGIDHYSQAVNISTNAFVGLSQAIVAEAPSITRDSVTLQNLTNMVAVGGAAGEYNKNAGAAAWDAGARSQTMTLAAAYGSYLFAQAEGTGRYALGLSSANTAADLATMDLAVELDGSSWRVWLSGAQRTNGTFAGTRSVSIRYYRSEPAGYYQIFVAGSLVFTGTLVLPDTLFADYAIFTPSTRILALSIDSATHTPATGIAPGYGKRFQVAPTLISKLKASQAYAIGTNQISVVGRDTPNSWIEFDRPIWIQEQAFGSGPVPTLPPSGGINAIYRSAITTSKKVTSIDVVMLASIWAKDSNGADLAHGQAFEVIIQSGAATYILTRLLLVNTGEQQIIRMFSIENLPKGIYTVRLQPLAAEQITAPIQALEDQSSSTTYTTGVTIGGQPIKITAELGSMIAVATARAYCGFAGKVQNSGDRGASIQITHVNEVVSAITAPTYPGYTIGYVELLASDRLQNAPALSWDIPKGAVVPNYLAYGKTLASDEKVITIDRPLLNIAPGNRVRVLGYGEWDIVEWGGNQITINENAYIPAGEELVVWRMDSSPYFPDHYVDRLINKADGLGSYVDQDSAIDYESIIKARQFCIKNRFYFDAVFNEGSFESWAIAAAPSSLLFATEINGRYALIPQERSRYGAFLFNDGNTISYVEPGVPWLKSVANTVLVKYQTNLGREKQVRIRTNAAFQGATAIIQGVTCQGVTSWEQAATIGKVSAKSLELQDRTCQIETDVDNGLYVRQGSVCRTQHTLIEKNWEDNGVVLESDETGVLLSEEIELTPTTRISISRRDTKEVLEALPIELLPNGRYFIDRLPRPLQPGDLWILGTITTEDRLWRITAVQPDIENNRVKLTCVKWSNAVLDIDDLDAD